MTKGHETGLTDEEFDKVKELLKMKVDALVRQQMGLKSEFMEMNTMWGDVMKEIIDTTHHPVALKDVNNLLDKYYQH